MRKKTSLKILYTSDLHGHALPMDYGTNKHAELGLAKIATAVKNKRQEQDQVIVIDNGDLIQGTPFMTHYVKEHTDKPNPMIAIMNEIGIDAAVLGNHEFNYGKKVLQQVVD